MPKKSSGNPAHTYPRHVMLKWLAAHLGKPELSSNYNLTTAVREDTPSPRSHHARRKTSNDETWTYASVPTTAYDDSTWVTDSSHFPSGIDSPEMGPKRDVDFDSTFDGYWDYYSSLGAFDFESTAWPITALSILNVPLAYTPLEFVEEIQSHKFGKDLNFIYLPRDPNRENSNWGTCTVNFQTEESTQACFDYYNGRKSASVFKKHHSYRPVKVFPARMQGIEWNIEELRKDPVLQKLSDDSKWRPCLFENGKPMPFAVPRRPIRAGKDKADSKGVPLSSEPVDPEKHTTVMLRNIPNKYTRSMLHERLKELYHCTDYNFIYIPIDFYNKCNVGYAFVNFRNKESVQKCLDHFHMVTCQTALPGFNSQKVVEVTPARVQGLENNVEHLQHAELIAHLRANSEWKPMIFNEAGESVPFSDNTGWKLSSGKGSARGKQATPKKRTSGTYSIASAPGQGNTVCISNLPSHCTRKMIVDSLNEANLKGEYDFVYVPYDVATEACDGTAYINFRYPKGATKFSALFGGRKVEEAFPKLAGVGKDTAVFRMQTTASMGNDELSLQVSASPVQGLDNNIENFKHLVPADFLKDYPDWAPLIFDMNGDRLSFPDNSDGAPKFNGNAAPFTPSTNAASFVPNLTPEEKSQKIATQVEFYFTPQNLNRDVFLRSHMDEDGYAPVNLLLRFPALEKLNATSDEIRKAVATISYTKLELKEKRSSSGHCTYLIRIKDAEKRQKWLHSRPDPPGL